MIEERIAQLRDHFSSAHSPTERYELLIALGRAAPHLDPKHHHKANRVAGCQSQMYLHAYVLDGLVFFEAEADALIANGLARLLVIVYSGLPPALVLQHPPTYLTELDIPASLSPSRANGLVSLHLRMKQEALKALMDQKSMRKCLSLSSAAQHRGSAPNGWSKEKCKAQAMGDERGKPDGGVPPAGCV